MLALLFARDWFLLHPPSDTESAPTSPVDRASKRLVSFWLGRSSAIFYIERAAAISVPAGSRSALFAAAMTTKKIRWCFCL